MISLSDGYSRTFRTLRVSLLSKCNFGCTYCTQETEAKDKNSEVMRSSELNFQELIGLISKLHRSLNLRTIRLTGGEPLLYPRLVALVQVLYSMGIPEVKLTTNGFLLHRYARILKMAGLQNINVSLDALDEEVFLLISKRSQLQKVLEGIEAALSEGKNVKINSVIMKGENHNQLLPLLEFANKKVVVIRFLELMGMGHLHQNSGRYFFSQFEMLETISARYNVSRLSRKQGSTANYWRTEHDQIFGIIANDSEPFCADCDRLRLDSKGNIFGCLSNNDPISILDSYRELEL